MGRDLDPKRRAQQTLCGNGRILFDEKKDQTTGQPALRQVGKSSPNNIFLALGKERSLQLLLTLLMAAKTFFRLNTDNS